MQHEMDFFLQQMAEGAPALRLAAARALGQMAHEGDEVDAEAILQAAIEWLDDAHMAPAVCLVLAEVGRERMFQALPEEKLHRALKQIANKSSTLLALDRDWGVISEEAARDAVAAVLDMALLPVPAGPFPMGTRHGGESDEKPQHDVNVGLFYIARYLVTNAQYARFVRATGRVTPKHWQDGVMPPELAWHPVVYIAWHDARAYAEWVGLRLPTEAEWEKAASWDAGAGRKREWPWGDEWDPERCNSSESGIGGTSPVGRFSPAGDSPCGAADMTGNVWEWCSSLYQPYPYQAGDGREDLEASGNRVLRGGAFSYNQRYARCACRYGLDPLGWYVVGWGFRVVVPTSLSLGSGSPVADVAEGFDKPVQA